MPGHNYIESINEGTNRSHGGKIFQIVAIGGTAPTAANVDMQGYAIGAIMINTTGTANNTTLYVNRGTTTTATWTALTVS
jgi:hypothetical protein